MNRVIVAAAAFSIAVTGAALNAYAKSDDPPTGSRPRLALNCAVGSLDTSHPAAPPVGPVPPGSPAWMTSPTAAHVLIAPDGHSGVVVFAGGTLSLRDCTS